MVLFLRVSICFPAPEPRVLCSTLLVWWETLGKRAPKGDRAFFTKLPTSWRNFRRAGLSLGEKGGAPPPSSLKSPRQETIHQQGKLRWLESSLWPRFQSQTSGVIGGLGSGDYAGERWADADAEKKVALESSVLATCAKTGVRVLWRSA